MKTPYAIFHFGGDSSNDQSLTFILIESGSSNFEGENGVVSYVRPRPAIPAIFSQNRASRRAKAAGHKERHR